MKYAVLFATALLLWAPAVRAEDSLVAAQKAYDAAWDAAPLAIQKAVLVAEHATGFGIYTPRPNNIYKAGEPVLIYTEPVGFGYKDNGNGTNTFGFSLDLSITGPDGSVIYSQENWQHAEMTSMVKNHEFMLTVDLDFGATPPPAGDYVLNFVVHDQNSSETAPISLPITLSN